MCNPVAAGYVIMAIGAGAQIHATNESNRANRAITRYNTAVAEDRATRARQAGAVAAAEHRDKVRRLVGAQRANVAARGFDPDSGSYSDLQFETLQLGAADADRIRYNAEMEALGHESTAVDLRLRQKLDDSKTGWSNFSSALKIGQAAAGAWESFKPPATTTSTTTSTTTKTK